MAYEAFRQAVDRFAETKTVIDEKMNEMRAALDPGDMRRFANSREAFGTAADRLLHEYDELRDLASPLLASDAKIADDVSVKELKDAVEKELRGTGESGRRVLEEFSAVTSRVPEFAEKLKPFQEEAENLLHQIEEEPSVVANAQTQQTTRAAQAFMKVLRGEYADPLAVNEQLGIISLFCTDAAVCFGLLQNVYVACDKATSASCAEEEESSSVAEKAVSVSSGLVGGALAPETASRSLEATEIAEEADSGDLDEKSHHAPSSLASGAPGSTESGTHDRSFEAKGANETVSVSSSREVESNTGGSLLQEGSPAPLEETTAISMRSESRSAATTDGENEPASDAGVADEVPSEETATTSVRTRITELTLENVPTAAQTISEPASPEDEARRLSRSADKPTDEIFSTLIHRLQSVPPKRRKN